MYTLDPCDRFMPTDDKPVEPCCVCCSLNYKEEVCSTLAARFQQRLAKEGGDPREPSWLRGEVK